MGCIFHDAGWGRSSDGAIVPSPSRFGASSRPSPPAESVHEGSTILLADGTATLTVLSTDPKAGTVRARVENTAKIGEKKNCNLPGVKVDLEILTPSDKEALLEFAVKNNIDFVFASFIQSAGDIRAIRDHVGPAGANLKVISKIESQLGILNFSARRGSTSTSSIHWCR